MCPEVDGSRKRDDKAAWGRLSVRPTVSAASMHLVMATFLSPEAVGTTGAEANCRVLDPLTNFGGANPHHLLQRCPAMRVPHTPETPTSVFVLSRSFGSPILL